jgi:hypothetical protein
MVIQDDLRGLARYFRRCLSVAMSELSTFYRLFAPPVQFAEMPYGTGAPSFLKRQPKSAPRFMLLTQTQSAGVSQSNGRFRPAR